MLISGDGALDASALRLPPRVLAELGAEAGLMCVLRHPNVCAFLGICQLPPCLVTGALGRGWGGHAQARGWRTGRTERLRNTPPAHKQPGTHWAPAHALPILQSTAAAARSTMCCAPPPSSPTRRRS